VYKLAKGMEQKLVVELALIVGHYLVLGLAEELGEK